MDRVVFSYLQGKKIRLNPTTLQTFPKHIPPKTASRESQDRLMIDEVNRGFGLYPLVEKKNPP
ncbi:MAG: hypothetical protein L7V85_05200, partial [Bacteroidia bacterium]|nr:hypothetical protein [Bacteroidia bacterium]